MANNYQSLLRKVLKEKGIEFDEIEGANLVTAYKILEEIYRDKIKKAPLDPFDRMVFFSSFVALILKLGDTYREKVLEIFKGNEAAMKEMEAFFR